MDTDQKRTPADALHPMVWLAVIGFVIWFVIAIWGFAAGGYVDWLLFVVSAFIFIAVMIPLILSRVGRGDAPSARKESFGGWAAGEFQTWQDRIKGRNAAAEIILPIAAAAIGMTAFAVVFHIAEMHAGV